MSNNILFLNVFCFGKSFEQELNQPIDDMTAIRFGGMYPARDDNVEQVTLFLILVVFSLSMLLIITIRNRQHRHLHPTERIP